MKSIDAGRAYVVACLLLAISSACGSNASPSVAGSTSSAGSAASLGGTGGASALGGSPNGPSGDTLCGAAQLSRTRTVAAGQTLTVCAGTTLTAGSGVALVVLGTLQINGTQAAPVRFSGTQAAAGSWSGIVVPSGGAITASYAEVHGAQTGLDAQAGSMFSLDHLLVDSANVGLSLASDGTLSHGVVHVPTAILVIDASPQISDTLINQGVYNGVDEVVINGANAAPVFDHVEVADAHCAFHINYAAGVTLTNSYVHHTAYGFMMGESTGSVFSHNNFSDNAINLGTCDPTATTGSVSGDFFEGDPTDSTCPLLDITGSAAAAFADVGPRP